jgi:DNA-binding Lrp family transcriptional regulator
MNSKPDYIYFHLRFSRLIPLYETQNRGLHHCLNLGIVGLFIIVRKSFVLIETDFGCTELALEELIKIEYVTRCCKLYGMYDIVLEIEAQTVQKLNEVISKIKNLQIVRSTTTTMIARSED